IDNLRNDQNEQEKFKEIVDAAREQINQLLPIQHKASLNKTIIHAANFSLENGGKRLRPVMTWVMGINEYGLEAETITPLLKSLEYMHTASLIFDDLPSQDDAKTRRGQPTLHQMYTIAIAELTGLYLTQKAIEEQTMLSN